MITRIAIENYRCFEQVVIEPGCGRRTRVSNVT